MSSVIPPPRNTPFKFFLAALDRALGECIIRAVFAATLKTHVKDADVTVYVRRDRPYKDDIWAIASPFVDRFVTVTGDNMLPCEYFYVPFDRHKVENAEAFRAAGHATQDVILPPTGMLEGDLLRFPSWPAFQIPALRRDEMFSKLRACRLSEDNWVVTLHYREPTYPLRGATPYRDVSSDEPYHELAKHIIHDLGGQVIRIGHKEMRDWPELNRTPGFVDLSRSDDFMLHAAAISISRFAVMTMGGPVSLCAPFGVPAMVSNAVGIAASGADPGFMLPKRIYRGDSSTFRYGILEMIDDGCWTTDFLRANSINGHLRLTDNTLDELKAGVAKLYEQTRPWVNFWRQPGEPVAVVKGPFNPQGEFVRKVNVMVP